MPAEDGALQVVAVFALLLASPTTSVERVLHFVPHGISHVDGEERTVLITNSALPWVPGPCSTTWASVITGVQPDGSYLTAATCGRLRPDDRCRATERFHPIGPLIHLETAYASTLMVGLCVSETDRVGMAFGPL